MKGNQPGMGRMRPHRVADASANNPTPSVRASGTYKKVYCTRLFPAIDDFAIILGNDDREGALVILDSLSGQVNNCYEVAV